MTTLSNSRLKLRSSTKMSLKVERPTRRDIHVAVDADIIAFRAAHVGESGKTVGLAMSVVADMLETISENLNVDIDDMTMYFTGSSNYRYILDPEYKGNRKDKPKPRYLSEVRALMESKYSHYSRSDYEADDLVHEGCVIASVDKDLLQIPGLHYDLTKQTTIRVTDVEGDAMLLRQAITGDSTDNIKGIKGMGPVKADAFVATLDPMTTIEEKLDKVRDLYLDKGYTEADFFKCLNCVYIQRSLDPALFIKGAKGGITLDHDMGSYEEVRDLNEQETTT